MLLGVEKVAAPQKNHLNQRAHFKGPESLNCIYTVCALFMLESGAESPPAANGSGREMDGAFVDFMYFNFIAF